jgi:DNA-binding CsgD family transcriptional regulator
MGTAAPLGTPQARRARARIVELSRRARADQAFLEEVSGELRQIVPFDGSFWGAADPLTTLATSPTRMENLANAEACAAFWETEFMVEDFARYSDLARAPQPAASLYRATKERPARSTRYRTFNRIFGYGDELRAVFRAERAAWGLLSLWRNEEMPAFSLGEEKLVADLSRTIAQAFRRTVIERDAFSDDGAADAPGLLTFDERGVLESLNEQAQAWLDELDTTGTYDTHSVTPLPTAILTVSARARAIAAGLEEGVARARVRARSGRWMMIHGFKMRGADDDRGRTALVIEPARASHVAAVIIEAYQLTQRELQITHLLSYGLSTGEIAARLHISPHTVRDYIKQVFEKVGVTSRGELVAKIFAEQYGPSFQAEIVHAPIGPN